MNKRIRIAFLLVAVALSSSSCTRIVLETLIIGRGGAQRAEYLEHTQADRSVVLIGMVHLGTPEYYGAVRVLLDSLRREGYVVFFEGVLQDAPRIDSIMEAHRPLDISKIDSLRALHPPNLADSLALDTLQRKLRKVVGAHLGGGYKNAENRSLPRAITRSRYVMQSNEQLGLYEVPNEHADLSLPRLIAAYEADKGRIVLSEYDLRTGLLDPYERWRSRGDSDFMIQTLRERHVIRSVEESPHRRIVILYGDMHRDALREELLENGYVKPAKK